MDKILDKGVLIRYRITTLKYLHNDFVSKVSIFIEYYYSLWLVPSTKITLASQKPPHAE